MKKKQKKLILDSDDVIHTDKFTKLYLYNGQKILTTRHQTTELDGNSVILINKLLSQITTVGQIISFAQKQQILKSETIQLLQTLLHMKAMYINQHNE